MELSLSKMAAVALGGGLGALARYLIAVQWIGAVTLGSFPIGTFTVNLIGAMFFGLLWVFAKELSISEFWRLFLLVGFCGGFTTFSTFSFEMYQLLDAGFFKQVFIYSLASVLICCVGMAAGIWLGQWYKFN